MAADRDERCENVLGCSIDEAFATLSGQAVSGPKPDPASSGFARGGEITASKERKSGVLSGNAEAADGIRTHDLLHGKQTL